MTTNDKWWSKPYPARYYAIYDTTASQPAPVGWLDMDVFSKLPAIVTANTGLIALSSDQWTQRYSQNYGAKSGVLVSYTPPAVVVPLVTQAMNAQTWIQKQANLAAAMGEVFTDGMKAYVKAIAAIANGTDTTSTVLPTQPTDVMEAPTSSTTTT